MNLLKAIFTIDRRKFLGFAVLAALILRLVLIVFVSDPQAIINDPIHKKLYEHGAIAHNLYTGHGFSMHWPYISSDSSRRAQMQYPPAWEGAFLPPLNPYLLYFSYLVFGETASALYAIMLFYAIISALIPLAAFKLASLISSEKAARISAIVSVLFLPSAYAVVTFSGSALYQVLGIVFLYYAICSIQSPSWKTFLGLGISAGVMTQLRSEFVFLGLFFILVVWVINLYAKRHISRMAVSAFVVCVAIIAPWTMRNYSLYHQVIPVLSHPWYELWRGDNVYATGTTVRDDGESVWIKAEYYPAIVHQMDSIPYDQYFEARVDGIFKKEVVDFIMQHPARFAGLGLKKLAYFFTFDPTQSASGSPFYWLPMIAVSILTLLGLYRLVQVHSSSSIIFLIFFAAYIGMTFMTVMLPRYQIYVFTCLIALTGLPANYIQNYTQKEQRMISSNQNKALSQNT